MAVLLADRMLALARRAAPVRDADGDVVGETWQAPDAAKPGRAEEGPDVPPEQIEGRTWVLALDPCLWPVAQRDIVVDVASGQRWLVTSADLRAHGATPAIDYVRVEAHMRPDGTLP